LRDINEKNITNRRQIYKILDSKSKIDLLTLFFTFLITHHPKNVAALDNKGLSFYHLGNYTKAITYYDSALAIDPKYVLALTDKGNALGGLGNYTKAITYYDKALAIDPRYIADLTIKGNFLNSLGNYRLAITYFDKD